MNIRARLAKLEQSIGKAIMVRSLTDTERAHRISDILLRDPASRIAERIRELLQRAAERRGAATE